MYNNHTHKTMYNPKDGSNKTYKISKVMVAQKCTKLATYSSFVSEGQEWIALALDNQGSRKNGPPRIEPAG